MPFILCDACVVMLPICCDVALMMSLFVDAMSPLLLLSQLFDMVASMLCHQYLVVHVVSLDDAPECSPLVHIHMGRRLRESRES